MPHAPYMNAARLRGMPLRISAIGRPKHVYVP